VFEALRTEVLARLAGGRSAVVDATNLERGHRMASARLAPPDIPVEYVVVDRPLDQKLADAVGWRADKPWLIRQHAEKFAAELTEIMSGDHLPNVRVIDARQTAMGAPASSERPEAA
jgi:predicted kinase